jgi:hypothetical protein
MVDSKKGVHGEVAAMRLSVELELGTKAAVIHARLRLKLQLPMQRQLPLPLPLPLPLTETRVKSSCNGRFKGNYNCNVGNNGNRRMHNVKGNGKSKHNGHCDLRHLHFLRMLGKPTD